MALKTLQLLTSSQRSTEANFRLGCLLAFVAGAVNAGGFLAINRYTSHMSGIISGVGDDFALGNISAVLGGLTLLASFLFGSATTAVLVNWGHRKNIRSQFAVPLLLEASLLLCFGILGADIDMDGRVKIFIITPMLCFVMGLQNAVITKISKAEIRTTHMTGVVTDIGIELGKLFYWNKSQEANRNGQVIANRKKLRTHALILSMFFVGGISGAVSFKYLGYLSVAPISLVLVLVSSVQIIRDLRIWWR
jgi:uncharacterized membrane protein YoaK (UPF0700 family)